MKSMLLAAVVLLSSMNVLAKGGEDKPAQVDVVNAVLPVQETVDISNHVVLSIGISATSQCAPISFNRALFRLGPDGVAETEEFVVPDGHVLIIKDVHWEAFQAPSFTPGQTLRMSLVIPASPSPRILFRSSRVDVTADNATGLLGGSQTLNVGVMIGAGQSFCARGASEQPQFGLSVLVSQAYLRGTLVPVSQ